MVSRGSAHKLGCVARGVLAQPPVAIADERASRVAGQPERKTQGKRTCVDEQTRVPPYNAKTHKRDGI